MTVRPGVLLTIGGLGLALTACAGETALATDAVRDAATAIRIGKAACNELDPEPRPRQTIWYAALKNGVWDVWSSDGHEHLETLEVSVRASDGVTGQCDGVIVVE